MSTAGAEWRFDMKHEEKRQVLHCFEKNILFETFSNALY